eukprot:GHVU01140651.1.p4 GENE.GHVU01140651.1~~GHVU01140651.1.p4  ORF type:complete len:102 (+),score=10.86 GHVU01140651.1:883-1188(+)
MLAGEERLSVLWDRSDGQVWFEVYSVSRLSGLLPRMCGPLVRRYQRLFARDAGLSATRLLKGGGPSTTKCGGGGGGGDEDRCDGAAGTRRLGCLLPSQSHV